MALIKCKECGKEISDSAEICPNCGCKTAHGETVVQAKSVLIQYALGSVCLLVGLFLLITNIGTLGELIDDWKSYNRYWSDVSFFGYLSDMEELGVFWKVFFGAILLFSGIVDMFAIGSNAKALNSNTGSELAGASQTNFGTAGMVRCIYCGTLQVRNNRYCCNCFKEMKIAPIGQVSGAEVMQAKSDDWQCACGRVNRSYISTCACGLSKRDGQRKNQ